MSARWWLLGSSLAVVMTGAAPAPGSLKEIVVQSGAGSWEAFQQTSGPERMNAAVRIGAAFANAHPRRAWPAVLALPPNDDREFLMRGVLRVLAQHDPARGVRALRDLPAGAERNVLARAFFDRWATLSPTAAADAVAEMPEGQARDAALDTVLVRWAAASAPAAAQWAAQLPSTRSGPVRPLVVFGMAGQSKLMGAQYDRDDAMQVVAFQWARFDRHAALRWAQSIADPDLRGVLVHLVEGNS